MPYIHKIETSTPPFSHRQNDLRERMKEIVPESDRDRKIIHYIYSKSGIETRHSVIDDFRLENSTPLSSQGAKRNVPVLSQKVNRNAISGSSDVQVSHALFFNGQGSSPGTASRNDTYIREGRKLFVDVAQKLIRNSDFNANDITHLITVSCTGFYAPGPDFDIIRALGLSPSIERYHLGFMGCYASIPALKMANQICKANPDANVMIVSVELCTLHFQANPKMDNILSASVFADGGSGAIVSSRLPERPAFRLNRFVSEILENSSKDMAWSIGDTGFEMILSNYIPDLLGDGMNLFLKDFEKYFSKTTDQIDLWAIHPGGRAILDKIEEVLNLPEHALNSSRKVLSEHGNMSSATIFYVLNDLINGNTEDKPVDNKEAIAMAFGPGLTLETAYLTLV